MSTDNMNARKTRLSLDSFLGGIFLLFLTTSIILAILSRSEVVSDSPKVGFQKGVGILKIFGPINYGNTEFGIVTGGVELWGRQLENLMKNPQVKAVVIQLNSPGGTAGSSSELYQKIQRLKKNHQKPVIISIADVGASGAYWIALAGDKILANSVSMVGSIGVIVANFDLTRVPERYGISQRTYKSAPYKDFLSSWREPSEAEEEIVDLLLADIHNEFVSVLAQSRELNIETARKLANGSVYSGRQAQSLKLIDKIGTLDDAIEYAASLTQLKMPVHIIRPKVVPFQSVLDIIGAQIRAPMKWLNSSQSIIPELR